MTVQQESRQLPVRRCSVAGRILQMNMRQKDIAQSDQLGNASIYHKRRRQEIKLQKWRLYLCTGNQAVENKDAEIKAYVVGDTLKEVTFTLGDMTDAEELFSKVV